MKFPTPEEMKENVYSQHGLNDEQLTELEMRIRHNMVAGLREFTLSFSESIMCASSAFRFLRLMEYDVSFLNRAFGVQDPNCLVVKI